MNIIDKGDRVEIIETVDEINKRYTDAGYPAPLVVINPVMRTDCTVGVKTTMTYEDFKELIDDRPNSTV